MCKTKEEKTAKFIARLAIVKKWFEDEELEVDDFVIGRMASRLEDFESQAKQEGREEMYNDMFGLSKFEEDMLKETDGQPLKLLKKDDK